jgi:hypothetical protein
MISRFDLTLGDMTPGLVNELRNLGLEVVCLDVRHSRAALEIRPSNPFAATSKNLKAAGRRLFALFPTCEI